MANKASLHVNGAPSSNRELMKNQVIFQGDRPEPEFEDIPGQWGSIWLTVGSTDNIIKHATIKNATVGIRMDSNDGGNNPTLTLKNVQIYNSAAVGLLAQTGHIYGENVVINNAGISSLQLNLGGIYNFVHCTFTNYWQNGFRRTPAVLISNYIKTMEQTITKDLKAANFTNCIIYGNQNIELILDKSKKAAFNFHFKNCLIRFNDVNDNFSENPLYDFSNTDYFENNVFNQDPIFLKPTENKLNIDKSSSANGIAIPGLVPKDILGNPRGSNPDAGAYESVDFSKE